jgi:hypothetical protein
MESHKEKMMTLITRMLETAMTDENTSVKI